MLYAQEDLPLSFLLGDCGVACVTVGIEAEAANKRSLVEGDLEEPTATLDLISRLPDEMLDDTLQTYL
jgi:hypothetical protein